jgi:hypothetical protein
MMILPPSTHNSWKKVAIARSPLHYVKEYGTYIAQTELFKSFNELLFEMRISLSDM